jgi:hypothetical protein
MKGRMKKQTKMALWVVLLLGNGYLLLSWLHGLPETNPFPVTAQAVLA